IATLRVSGQVELDDVVRRASGELRTLRVVDHVIGRGDDVGERSDPGEVVVDPLNWTDLRHERGTLASHGQAHIRHVSRPARLVRSVRMDSMTYPPYMREKARRLRAQQELTIDEIAARMAVSRTTVYFWVADMPRPERCRSRRGSAHALGNKAMQVKYKRLRDEAYELGRWE